MKWTAAKENHKKCYQLLHLNHFACLIHESHCWHWWSTIELIIGVFLPLLFNHGIFSFQQICQQSDNRHEHGMAQRRFDILIRRNTWNSSSRTSFFENKSKKWYDDARLNDKLKLETILNLQFIYKNAARADRTRSPLNCCVSFNIYTSLKYAAFTFFVLMS